MITKVCTGPCGLEKDVGEFYDHSNNCKKCYNTKCYDYRRRSDGTNYKIFFKMRLRYARSTANTRENRGREEAGICTLTIDDIMDMHEKQKGLCYYSGIPYTCKTKSDFKGSLERLDPSKGYTKDNVVITTSEFNHVSQWSLEKVRELYRLLYTKHDPNIVNFELEKKEKRPPTMYKKEFIDGVEHVNCCECKLVKPLTEFTNHLRYGCRECRIKNRKQNYDTPRGHILKLKSSMKDSTKKRNKKRHSHDDSEFELQDMIDLFDSQNGLCAYSGIPMAFGSYNEKWWICSPERIDTTKGYVKRNVCLICYEFNTTVHIGGDGNSGWSKEKIETLKLALKEKYNNVVG